jgi:hypothetical protein
LEQTETKSSVGEGKNPSRGGRLQELSSGYSHVRASFCLRFSPTANPEGVAFQAALAEAVVYPPVREVLLNLGHESAQGIVVFDEVVAGEATKGAW